MKFTTEELTEMRKLAGIEYAAVDYRRPQDFLAEAREPVSQEIAEATDKVPPKTMPKKPSKLWTTKNSSKTPLKALLAKHKAAAEVSTGRKPAVEKPVEKDGGGGGEVSTGRKPAIEKM